MPNSHNDYIEVYHGNDGDWHWRRRDGANHQIVAVSGEGYANRAYARSAAETYNDGDLPIVEPDD